MGSSRGRDQWMIKLVPGAGSARLSPIARVRDQSIMKSELFADFQTRVRRDSRLIASVVRIGLNSR